MKTEAKQSPTAEMANPLGSGRWPVVAGVVLALAVLASSILISLLHLRRQVFTQIANRDGETLKAVADVQFANDKENDQSVTTLADPSEQIQLALKISSRLRSVLGVRLFSADGKFITAFPPYITETTLGSEDLTTLRELRPVSHFMARAQLQEQDLLAETNSKPVPLLVVNIPLKQEGAHHLEAIAQFLVHGSSIAHEYADVDKHLAVQGALAFFISGAIITGGLLLAFGQVERANLLLAERTGNLLKANRELALAAKTSAIGAVSSHLIHGLKNPLSGLRSFVDDRARQPDSGQNSDWQLAAATTRRMQDLIDRVVRVLQEQQTTIEYELSLAELLEILAGKFQPLAHASGISYSQSLTVSRTISNREADLLLLILENLLQNALDATSPGKAVSLKVFAEGAKIILEVQDQGSGLLPEIAERLFTPCPSAKKGGSGIGLAISRQLAVHLGANLQLKQSSPNGCCFRLVLPEREGALPPTSRPPGSGLCDTRLRAK